MISIFSMLQIMLTFVALVIASCVVWCDAKCVGTACGHITREGDILGSYETSCKGRDRTFAFNETWQVRSTVLFGLVELWL